MREKQFKNTPMGRSKVPVRTGEYMLLDKSGNIISNGWEKTDNLNRRIKEEHYKRHGFSYIKIRYGRNKKNEKIYIK